MTGDETIRTAQARVRRLFTDRPEAARSTASGHAEITDGLTCVFTQGAHSTVMDMPEAIGGAGQGPSPGFHARAAVAGCVAIGIKQTAAYEGIALDSVRVEIEMDFDDAALFGLGANSAAPLATRIVIRLGTDESSDVAESLVAKVLDMDPFFLALRDSQAVSTQVHIGSDK